MSNGAIITPSPGTVLRRRVPSRDEGKKRQTTVPAAKNNARSVRNIYRMSVRIRALLQEELYLRMGWFHRKKVQIIHCKYLIINGLLDSINRDLWLKNDLA